MSAVNKYLLCRPTGGINDIFCQIEMCWDYAEKYNRNLIIDTTNHLSLMANFSDFFSPLNRETHINNVFFSIPNEKKDILNNLTCRPCEIQHKIHQYKASHTAEGTLDSASLVKLTFDFDKNYIEDLLVHDQFGGGKLSFKLLERLVINDNIIDTIHERLNKFDPDYIAVHVRNTDYKTDYQTFFQKIYNDVANKSVLICSDDTAVIQYAKYFFNKSIILTSSDIPDLKGKPLHKMYSYENREDVLNANINSIVDLVAMGLSRKLFITNTSFFNIFSGFSSLALHLNNNRSIAKTLLRKRYPFSSGYF
jgi:hypothetical protein